MPTGTPPQRIQNPAKPGSPGYNAAYGTAVQNFQNQYQGVLPTSALQGLKPGSAEYNAAYAVDSANFNRLHPIDPRTGMPQRNAPAPTTTPGTTTTITADPTAALQQILSQQYPGMPFSIAPGGGSAMVNLGSGGATGTNLGAYGGQTDQFSNPPADPGLSYLGLPNYGGEANNNDNGFAALFGAQTNEGSFLSTWG